MSSTNSETRKKILETTSRMMEENRGKGVRMSDIAAAAGVSRQAVYLHFNSRTELMIATTHYMDEMRGLDKRLTRFREASSGTETLEEFVEFWGNYIPEIYGIAKALLAARESDEAAAAAWNDRMNSIRSGCRRTIEALSADKMLAPIWTEEKAIDLMWTLLSVQNWEHLTIECGWTTEQYIEHLKMLLKRSFVLETR